MTDTVRSSANPWEMGRIALINGGALLAKSHALCCIAAPIAANLAGGGAAAAIETPAVQLALGMALPPVVTFATMALEKKEAAHAHDGVACGGHGFSWRKFGLQTAVGYAVYGMMHLAAPYVEAAAEKVLPHDMFEMLYDEHKHAKVFCAPRANSAVNTLQNT